MKRKILVTGVDGTGKTTLLDALVARLDSTHRVLRVGTSEIYWSVDGEREPLVSQKWEERLDRLRETSRRLHAYGAFLVVHFFYKYALSKYFEIFREADLVVFSRDTLLHPAVYLAVHFPRAARILPVEWRFGIFRSLFGSARGTLIFYLETDPAISVDRIQRRESEGGGSVDAHENPRDLQMLRREFEKILRVAAGHGYEIVRIETGSKGPEEVATEAEAAVRRRSPSSAAGDPVPRPAASRDC